jgi:hypothetical protein
MLIIPIIVLYVDGWVRPDVFGVAVWSILGASRVIYRSLALMSSRIQTLGLIYQGQAHLDVYCDCMYEAIP